jgi:four helix bundle protein
MSHQDYTELLVWQRSQELTLLVYRFTNAFPPQEQYGLSQQLRRAAISISSNIAEGSNRRTVADRRRYIGIAYGSALEVESQLSSARLVGLIGAAQYRVALVAVKHVLRLLNCYYKKPM